MATAALLANEDTADELWKECARWLTRCGMLRADHRANWPEAGIADVANILRDGVLLCKLLNKLDPGCIDMKDVHLKPAMAQFLSLHNITMFLKTCKDSFGLKNDDLFDPIVLFELSNFHKVLCTLSKLSMTSKVLQSNIVGFRAHRASTNEEVIYQSLKAVDLRNGTSRDIVDGVDDKRNEEIYQDLCELRNVPELQPTFEKRDFVIKELLETEHNYVDVLSKLQKNFMVPLSRDMKASDHETVFYKINELYEVHKTFYGEFRRSRDPGRRLGTIFMNMRERFLVYGAYCANLTRATNLLQELCENDEQFNQTVIKYEQNVNNGRFKLRDVLSVPMQRILKYHLLLEKMIENTDLNHDDYKDLRRAREAMLDVADYINEAARDSEHLAVINNLQENIVEWTHAPDHKLAGYGRLIKDGEMRIQSHCDRRTRNRYVFIFDKCILICKQLKGQQFAFRDMINLIEYHIDEMHSRQILNRDARWSYLFNLVKNDGTTVYTIFMRTMDLKHQMMKAITDALDHIHPQALRRTNHKFELTTFPTPVQCLYCSKYLKGLMFQGYKCSECGVGVHRNCIGNSGKCPPPPPQQHPHHRTPMRATSSNESIVPNSVDDANLREKLWFVGEMDRETAQNELENRENGTFLVRIRPQSDERDKYALTLKTNNTVKHMKICNVDSEEKKYYLSLSKFFNTVEELVLNYQLYSLKENFENLDENTKLLWPVRQFQALVLRNFEPSDSSHLRLIKDEFVTVLGKEGYDYGWWKGKNGMNEVGYFPHTYVRTERELLFN